MVAGLLPAGPHVSWKFTLRGSLLLRGFFSLITKGIHIHCRKPEYRKHAPLPLKLVYVQTYFPQNGFVLLYNLFHIVEFD